MKKSDETSAEPAYDFRFLTNYTLVVVLISRQPDVRMSGMAAEIGITERAVQRIVNELTDAGYLLVTREGRRNRYQVVMEMPLRHKIGGSQTVGSLVRFVNEANVENESLPAQPVRNSG